MWQRPEELAGTVTAAFVNSAEVEAFAHDLEVEAHSNPVSAYIHRVVRHIEDLQKLPALITSLPQKIVGAFIGTSADDVTRDIFGFHKVIVCATDNGRLIALDAGTPNKILWNEKVVMEHPTGSWTPSLASADSGLVNLTRLKAG